MTPGACLDWDGGLVHDIPMDDRILILSLVSSPMDGDDGDADDGLELVLVLLGSISASAVSGLVGP